MKLPKLKIYGGNYLGMKGGCEVYGADYYLVKDVDKYKHRAREILAYATVLEKTLSKILTEDGNTLSEKSREEIAKVLEG